ncbi:MAG: glutamyl-tRNA reductase [Oscillospiraceae bacterium]|nr:glutamyl-tRNA reductase [Oscillospiraceae bacterium]
MNIFVVGISHKTAPVEIREKLSVNNIKNAAKLSYIIEQAGSGEGVLLSTCNRTEVYLYEGDIEKAKKALCSCCGLKLDEFESHLYCYEMDEAVTYLFKVTAGLDSLVIGEDEILRQVKDAHQIALESKLAKTVMNTLFKAAVTTSKKIKAQTGLSSYAVSVGTIAVNAAKECLGSLYGKTALVIGSGEMGIIALRNLVSVGVKSFVTIRTRSKIIDLSDVCPEATAINYEERYEYISKCDIIISCTSSPHFTITAEDLDGSIKMVKPRIFIDLAVPRDIDENVTQVDEATYLNIDDLQQTADENKKIRLQKAQEALEMIEKDAQEFGRWFEFRKGANVLKKVRECANRSASKRICYAQKKLENPEDLKVVEQAVNSTVDSILKTFLYNIKDVADQEEIKVFLKCMDQAVANEDEL